MIDFLLFILYKVVKFLVLLLPKRLIKFILDILANLIYLVDIKHKKIAKTNLDEVFKNSLKEDRKKQIIKNSYKNLVYNIYEFIQNQTLKLEDFEQKIDIVDEHHLTDAIKNKRKIILITAHYGNWEYGNIYIPLKYAPTTMVGRPLNNRFLNDELDKTRTKNNNEMLTKNEASRGLVKALKNDRILGLVIDQNNSKGVEVDFLNNKIKMIDSASRLAMKFDAVIIPVFFTPKEFSKYEMRLYKPIEANEYKNKEQGLEKLTQYQANILSAHIIKQPDFWLWQHKIFKEFKKDIYEQ